MRADGSNQRNLTNNGLANDSPTFSPDGTRIAFSSTLIGGNAQVLVMPATGGAPVSLSGPDGRSAAPTWGPGTVSAPPPVAIPAPVSFKATPNAVTVTSDTALKLRFAALPGATGTLKVCARVPAKTAAAASAASARTTRRVTLIPKRAFRASASGNVSVRVRINARRLARLPRARRRFAVTLSVTIGGRTFTDSFTLRRSSRKR